MTASHNAQSGKGGLDLIEEAMHALRLCPVPVLAVHLVGVLPFVLGFLFFWSDMTRNTYALEHCVGASLIMGVLYFWMKIWQAVFCRKLLQFWAPHSPMVAPGMGAAVRSALAQWFILSTALPMQVLASLLLIPFGWVYAFYQNVTVLGFTQDLGTSPTRSLIREAARQSNYLPRQNHLILLVGMLFALYVWVNTYMVAVILPFLLKRLLGMESVFTTNPAAAYFNTTFFAVTVAFAFLFVSPLVKIVYTLRCFYGLSLTTGADLSRRLAMLRTERARAARAAAAALVVFLASAAAIPNAGAQGASDAAAPGAAETAGQETLSGRELSRAIDDVISQSQYQWRMPREHLIDAEGGPVERFFRRLADRVRSFLEWIADSVDSLFNKLREWLYGKDVNFEPNPNPTVVDWESAVRGLIYLLGGLVILTLVVVALRGWRRRQRMLLEAEAGSGPVATVDLESEEIVASQLPEDEWMKLAQDQIERGDFRLAVRALFLASLARLAEKQMLRIQRSKSNLDYQRELKVKAASETALHDAFGDNVKIFERAWYGMHAISREVVDVFRSNYERIAAHG